MLMRARARWLPLMLMVVLAGCAAPVQPGTQSTQPSVLSPQSPSPKRLVVAIRGTPATVSAKLNTSGGRGSVPGGDEIEELLNTRLGMVDDRGSVRPYLAESIPTVETGSWQLLPDGAMETTWRIRPTARWHDGAPFTAADVVFSFKVWEDQEIGVFRDNRYATVETVDAPDPLTFRVRWRKPYIYADRVFDTSLMPQHLLEPIYRDAKATFTQVPYWTQEFVGTGAFRGREWATGTSATVQAFDGYVLGRSRLDEIQVKFILDPNALLANVLAGEVDGTMGLGLSLDQGVEAQEQWKSGKHEVVQTGWMAAFPQLLYTNPLVIRDLRFRRALLHALDREAMADTLLPGMSGVAHSFVATNQPEYADVQPYIVRYEYDPRRSRQLIEELGYSAGTDGFYRDATNQRLTVEARTNDGWDIHFKTIYPVADYWQRAGVATDPVVNTRAQAQDPKNRATFPGFEVLRNPNDMGRLLIFHSSQIRTPENNYVGANYMNYTNPEWDALLDRFFATIPTGERNQALGQIVHFMTDQLLALGIIYNVDSSLIGNRMQNIAPANSNVRSPMAWNAHQWDIGS